MALKAIFLEKKQKSMVKIKPDEISSIIAQQLERYDQEVKYSNVGVVMSIGECELLPILNGWRRFSEFK